MYGSKVSSHRKHQEVLFVFTECSSASLKTIQPLKMGQRRHGDLSNHDPFESTGLVPVFSDQLKLGWRG